MATRSTIALEYADGTVDQIYCHWDGYLEHNGAILNEFYSNSVDVNRLIATGDISSLGARVGEKMEFDHRWADSDYIKAGNTYASPQCIFYGRDRGEKETEFMSFNDEQAFLEEYDGRGAEFFYLFDNGVWYVKSYKGDFKPLHEELARLVKEPA